MEQQPADALALVVETALHRGIDPGAPGERYQVVVHIDASVLADADAPGQSVLEGATRVPAGTSQRLACDASCVVTWLPRLRVAVRGRAITSGIGHSCCLTSRRRRQYRPRRAKHYALDTRRSALTRARRCPAGRENVSTFHMRSTSCIRWPAQSFAVRADLMYKEIGCVLRRPRLRAALTSKRNARTTR